MTGTFWKGGHPSSRGQQPISTGPARASVPTAGIIAGIMAGAVLAGCQSMPIGGGADVPAAPLIESAESLELDYSRFEARRREAAGQASGRADSDVPGGFSDPTFPASIGTAAVISDPDMHQRLATVVEQLLKHWPREAPAINIAVTDSAVPSPSVTPGATIVVPRGFLEMSKSLDELHFVVAHEMAHVLLDHFRDAERQRETEQRLSTLHETVEQLEREHLTARHDDQPVDASGALETVELNLLLGNQYIFGPAFNRRQEVEADRLGLDLAVRAGFGFIGAYKSIQRIMNLQQQARERYEERCGRIDRFWTDKLVDAVSERWRGLGGSEATGERDPACEASQNVLEAVFDQDSHPDPEQRWQEIQQYVDAFYSDMALTVQHESDNNLVNLISPDGTLARSGMASRALERLQAGDLEAAERLAYDSLDGSADPTPLPRWAMYRVRRAQHAQSPGAGYLSRAITNLEIAVDGGFAPRRMHLALAEEYAALARYDDAMVVLDGAAAQFNDPEAYFPLRIRWLARAGHHERVEAVLDRCRRTGDSGLIARCRSAAAEQA